MKNQEVWRDVKNYEGLYQVSNLGRVKSLERYVKHWRGGNKIVREIILKQAVNGEYEVVRLSKKGDANLRLVHQLVAESFLNHKPNGHKLVIDHIDDNPLNNNVSNLRIVTNRENTSKNRGVGTSKYMGVSWCKRTLRWMASIYVDNKNKHLGYFKSEKFAAMMYKRELSNIKN